MVAINNSLPRFKLGHIVVTTGALSAIAGARHMPDEFLNRHQRGDWGDLDEEDKRSNDAAIVHEGDVNRQGRLLSAYKTNKGARVWVITEYDRSLTTVLLPEEY